MSTLLRTESTNGTSKFRPGLSVRLYLPSRSTTSIRCCGTMRTDRSRVTTAKTTMTMMSTPITASMVPSLDVRQVVAPHDHGGAVDLDNPDALAREDLVRAVGRAGLPDLSIDLDRAVVGADLVEDGAVPALDRRDTERRLAALQGRAGVPHDD